jgi:hypothetical protein
MFRTFYFPLFLTALLAFPLPVLADARHANTPLWQSIVDYEEKHAFDNYGPPTRENAAKFAREQQLYEDMVQHFDETAEDEPDFTFIVESYSVPVETFRPAVVRPEGQAIKEDEDNPFGEDDPLPEAVKSTSAYVEEIRPTFFPGKPLKMRSGGEVQLGNDQLGSLFADTDKLKQESAVLPKPVGPPQVMGPPLPPDHPPAGQIDQPKKEPVKKAEPVGPVPGSDEETLMNLRQAVKELGLERQLNFDGSTQAIGSGADIQDATPVPGTVGPPMPEIAGPPMPAAPKTVAPKKTTVPKAPAKKPVVKKPPAKPVKPPVAAPPKPVKAPPPVVEKGEKKPAPPPKVLRPMRPLSPEELAKVKQEDKPDFGFESGDAPSPRNKR